MNCYCKGMFLISLNSTEIMKCNKQIENLTYECLIMIPIKELEGHKVKHSAMQVVHVIFISLAVNST